jgi:hypothetical protein
MIRGDDCGEVREIMVPVQSSGFVLVIFLACVQIVMALAVGVMVRIYHKIPLIKASVSS